MRRKLEVEALEVRNLTAGLHSAGLIAVPRLAGDQAAATAHTANMAAPDYTTASQPAVVGACGLSKNHNRTLVRARARRGKFR